MVLRTGGCRRNGVRNLGNIKDSEHHASLKKAMVLRTWGYPSNGAQDLMRGKVSAAIQIAADEFAGKTA